MTEKSNFQFSFFDRKQKNDLHTMKQILFDGSSDICQMASLERF